jgi:copper chaperone CopZ
MKKHTFEVPTLYGDHHVLEVRRILAGIPGVQEVYASSSFQVVEVEYDETKTNDLEIAETLDEAGYLGEWSIPIEVGAIRISESDEKPSFRHTEVFENVHEVVSFAQNVSNAGRPLWPCPGMGVIKNTPEED